MKYEREVVDKKGKKKEWKNEWKMNEKIQT